MNDEDFDYPFAAQDGTKLRAVSTGFNDFRLYRWAESSWWQRLALDGGGKDFLREVFARLTTDRIEELAAPADLTLLRVDPQPMWIPSSGRWNWPIPEHLRHPGCCESVCTASHEWFEYLQEDQKPHPAAGAVMYGDAWYWVLPGQSSNGEQWADGSLPAEKEINIEGVRIVVRISADGVSSLGLADMVRPVAMSEIEPKYHAGRARTEGDPRRVVSLQSDESGLYLVLGDGTAWYGKHWPPEWERVALPPIEPEIKAGAEECELPAKTAASISCRHDSWGFDSIETCDECGVARSAARNPQSFAADAPASALPDDLRKALRDEVFKLGVRIPAGESLACHRCGLWAADCGDLCAKCFAELQSENGA